MNKHLSNIPNYSVRLYLGGHIATADCFRMDDALDCAFRYRQMFVILEAELTIVELEWDTDIIKAQWVVDENLDWVKVK